MVWQPLFRAFGLHIHTNTCLWLNTRGTCPKDWNSRLGGRRWRGGGRTRLRRARYYTRNRCKSQCIPHLIENHSLHWARRCGSSSILYHEPSESFPFTASASPPLLVHVRILGGCVSVHNAPDLRVIGALLFLCVLRGCKLHFIFISFYSIVYNIYTRTVYRSYLSICLWCSQRQPEFLSLSYHDHANK
jgi:hypothetical protein